MPSPPRPLEDRYGWRPVAGSTGRYVDRATGRYVSELTVRTDIDEYIDALILVLIILMNQLRNHEISLAEWQTRMRDEIKKAHMNAAMIASGGRDQMTNADWQRTGRELRTQYEYLDKWAAAIAIGAVVLDGRANARAKLYGNASRGTYEQQRRAMAADRGNDEEMRILHAKESCAGCMSVAGYWAPIGTLPKIGSQQCATNCLCTLSYRKQPA